MPRYRRCILAGFGLLLAALPGVAWEPEELWAAWPQARVLDVPAPCIGPGELAEALEDLARDHAGELELTVAGQSVEGRPIHLLRLGRGERRVLLWSQMHGDEPTATPALLDLARYLLTHATQPAAARVLDELELLLVPMLNPDGTVRYQRRNAQGIDINRDALHQATPEGRLLAALRERFEPVLGFNLHDQNRRTQVGDSGRLAVAALLAVAGDAAGTMTPGRERARRAASSLLDSLEAFVPGHVARYDEDWSPRAFGDNITAWGTPVVLLESGGLLPGRNFEDLTRLNFVALLRVLEALAADDLAAYGPEPYEALPRNLSGARVDTALRGGRIQLPGVAAAAGAAAFRADLAFNRPLDDQAIAGCRPVPRGRSRIVEIGDGSQLTASRELDADGLLIAPALAARVEGWRQHRWLDATALDRLTGQGIARIVWEVAPRRRTAATARARELAAPGRAHLEVRSAEERSPDIAALPPLDPGTAAPVPGPAAGRHYAELALEVGAEATFRIFTTTASATPRLVAIWIDGIEVELRP